MDEAEERVLKHTQCTVCIVFSCNPLLIARNGGDVEPDSKINMYYLR